MKKYRQNNFVSQIFAPKYFCLYLFGILLYVIGRVLRNEKPFVCLKYESRTLTPLTSSIKLKENYKKRNIGLLGRCPKETINYQGVC